jgi:hypothetical protein
MPFGLTNGLAIFQQFINKVFMDYFNNFITAFVDNILIYSNNKVEHQEHVKKVLKHLWVAGLQASIKKCEFLVTQTKYLGFIITLEGIKVNPEKMVVIHSWN